MRPPLLFPSCPSRREKTMSHRGINLLRYLARARKVLIRKGWALRGK